jgi:hypothetical protein
MRAKAGILLIICFLFLIETVAAVGIPDTVTVTTDKPWIIANNGDQSTITVKVTNTTPGFNGDVQGVTVNLVVDPQYGTLSPATITTNLSGMASSTFKVKTKSGAAQINATIPATAISDSVIQNIDHDSPYYPYFSHQLSGTVASEVSFNASITDRWGNPIDRRRGPHNLTLEVHGPTPDDCGFAEAGYNHTISQPLDANGNTSVMIRLTTKVGPNNILMNALGSIPDKLEWINADTNGIPFSMTQFVSPSGSPPSIPADGTSFFTIVYTLFDKYGNPTNEQSIWVNTSVSGEEKKFLSNNLGQVTIQYGPRSSIGEINIIATAVSNTSVNSSQWVKFKNTGAEIISLTANPDVMPSQDANPSFVSDVIAMVADQSGNAVPGEIVVFTIEDVTYNPFNLTANPVLLTTSAITDEYGQAVVQFRPGSFTTAGNPGYNASATGKCKLNATWRDSTKIVPITWKNYPYLSVKTSVTPLTVEINKTIDVTIEFRGDGWALQPKPIDVVLATDRSGSMLKDQPDDRMVSVMKASRSFINQMDVSPSQDHIGLISFGTKGWAKITPTWSSGSWSWTNIYGSKTTSDFNNPGWWWVGSDNNYDCNPNSYSSSSVQQLYVNTNYPGNPRDYSNYAITEQSLSSSKATINSSINRMVPAGGTPMRHGIYAALNEIITNGNRPDVVRAIIVLSDGDYNFYGDPLARGSAAQTTDPEAYPYRTGDQPNTHYWPYSGLNTSEQNLSFYAKSHNIRIYTIGYAEDISAYGKITLIALAQGTDGGKYYDASAADIADVYKAIAGDLKDNAGVNTTMIADFENVNVTNFAMPGDQVFDYVYHPTDSTKITWQNGLTNVTDQSADWAADSKLSFSIGTIKVGQFWNATFRLRVNQSGLIDVFGHHSTVSFNGGKEVLNLPQTFITVVPNLNATVIGAKTITLTNLTVTENGEIKALLPVMWNMSYTGNNTVFEKIYYSIDNGDWILFATKSISGYAADPTLKEYVEYAQLDVTKLPPGGFKIMVYATAPDAADTSAITDVKTVGGKGKTFIKLE